MTAHLKTLLLPGVATPDFDAIIEANLLMETVTIGMMQTQSILVGIANHAGNIYRLIGAMQDVHIDNVREELAELDPPLLPTKNLPSISIASIEYDHCKNACHAIFRQKI